MKSKQSLDLPFGIALFTSGWFRDVGLQKNDSETSNRVEEIGDRVCAHFSEYQPQRSGVLYSPEEARSAGREMRSKGVELVLLIPLMWCEDDIVRAFLAELPNVEIVLWIFSPDKTMPDFQDFQSVLRGSGPVCALQLSGMFSRERLRYRVVAGGGDDESTVQRIESIIRAYFTKRAVRDLRIGVLPFPCSHMSTTYVDEFGLRAHYGVELRYIELAEVAKAAVEVDSDEISRYRESSLPPSVAIKVADDNLEAGIRFAIAMEQIAKTHHLGAIAMNDVIPEMHQSFGLRPSLPNPSLGDAGIVVSMEADIAAAVAMFALRKATGHRPFYTEVLGADYTHNSLLLGHAGYHDESNADSEYSIEIIPDVEYENSDRYSGCSIYFKYRPGPVTIVNCVWDGEGLAWTVFEGNSEPGGPRMAGNCHLLCVPKPNVARLLEAAANRGVSQHWIAIPGHVAIELLKLADVLDIETLLIE